MTRLWKCPECGKGLRAPGRLRKNDTRRYCLPCSAKTGKLVERVCPAAEKKRGVAADKAKKRGVRRKCHPDNETGVKSLDVVAADPRVVKVWSEGEDGYWAELKPGHNFEGCSTVHQWTVEYMKVALDLVEEGDPY